MNGKGKSALTCAAVNPPADGCACLLDASQRRMRFLDIVRKRR